MNYKLIVLDMDGTLLNINKEVTEENKRALAEAQSRGIEIAIATGRIYTSARFYAKLLGITAPIMACNGAIIREESTNKVLDISPIDQAAVLKVMEVFKSHGVYFHIYDEETIYVEELGFSTKIYNSWNEDQSEENKVGIEKVDDLYAYVRDEEIRVLKMMAVDDDAIKMQIIKEELRNIDAIDLDQSWYNNLEVMAKGISKGRAIGIFSEKYGYKKDEIIAFGDNYNDLSMKEYVKTFVAMGNSEEDIKIKADYVTDTNENSGVGKGIQKLVLDN